MSDHLPQELVTDILLRLPAADLARYTCVCKSWYALITNPNFIKSHLTRRSVSTNSLFTIMQYPNEKVNCSLHIDDKCQDWLDCPLDTDYDEHFLVVGSCHGLVCLFDDHLGILWNPAIRKFVNLPQSSIKITSNHFGPRRSVLGFGFDAKKNDYKVVRVLYPGILDPPMAEIYSLKTGSWRGITGHCSQISVDHHWLPVFMNGAVHWPAFDWSGILKVEGDNFRSLVLSFDVSNEIFHKMSLPESLENVTAKFLIIGVLAESLSAVYCDHDLGTLSIWVMKEYGIVESWTKIYTIDNEGTLWMALGLSQPKVLLALRGGELVSDHPKIKQITEGVEKFYVDNYVDSLVLLKEGNGIPKRQRKETEYDEGRKKRREEPGENGVETKSCKGEKNKKEQKKALQEMSNPEKLMAAGRIKEEGNLLFKRGKYRKAGGKYIEALKYVSDYGSFGDDEQKLVNALLVSCNLNTAACCLKLNHFAGAIELTSLVLAVEFHNVKALYRRAQAYMETADLYLAESDIKKALEVDPQNKDVKLLQKNLKQLQAESNQRDSKLYTNMFARMTKEPGQVSGN